MHYASSIGWKDVGSHLAGLLKLISVAEVLSFLVAMMPRPPSSSTMRPRLLIVWSFEIPLQDFRITDCGRNYKQCSITIVVIYFGISKPIKP